jgi:hypothetical protein
VNAASEDGCARIDANLFVLHRKYAELSLKLFLKYFRIISVELASVKK